MDGPLSDAKFGLMAGMALNPEGTKLYIAEYDTHRWVTMADDAVRHPTGWVVGSRAVWLLICF